MTPFWSLYPGGFQLMVNPFEVIDEVRAIIGGAEGTKERERKWNTS